MVNETVKITTPITTRFFPTYGTPEFFQQCRWTARRQTNNNCTMLARPNPQTNEGISNHFAEIVSGHMIAQQKGCLFYFDYGPEVDIEKVLIPFPVIEESAMTKVSTTPMDTATWIRLPETTPMLPHTTRLSKWSFSTKT